MNDRISTISGFLLQLDALKSVNRRTYINGGERVENSAEHSWHLAIACWAFAELLEEDFDTLKLIKLALVHDLGEIGAGDTHLYSKDREKAHLKERESIEELASHEGNPISDIAQLWDEQEFGQCKEAKLLKVIDRLLPFLHNLASEGRTWHENGVIKSQVLTMHQFIEDESPEIHAWFVSQVEHAVKQGWLKTS